MDYLCHVPRTLAPVRLSTKICLLTGTAALFAAFGAQSANAATTTQSSPLSALLFLAASAADADGDQDTAPAAQADPQTAEEEEPNEAIVITGSRIVRDGYDAPTPVSVISTKELKAEAPANITDFVNTLPAVRGSGTAANSNGALSNGAAGVNSINLRNLGTARTLVLFDGQRSVASTTTGAVDVNTFPQALIERVEVVTGGASSAYGSDAVSGVVNFILNKRFTGVSLEAEHGVTTYGDGPNYKLTATVGKAFLDDKLRVVASGEYFKQVGIQSIDRDWNDVGFFTINNPQYSASACTDSSAATICYPEYLVTAGAGTGTFTPGGLVTSGALRGTYFGVKDPATGLASVKQLAFGQTSGQWMVGGDYNIASEGHRSSATLVPAETRKSAFGRISYEVSPAIEVFGQVAYTKYNGQSFYQQTPTTGVNIRIDNPFLPTSVRTAMQNANLSSISIGTSNLDLGPQGSDNTREVYRYVLGASGQFNGLGRSWNWSTYYQFGLARTHEMLTNAWNLQRMTNATDAVMSGGQIVCRINVDASTTNDDPACVPLNRLGVGVASQAAIDYVMYKGFQPTRDQRLKEKVASIEFSTNELFTLPAGPVSLAFGGEWREEGVSGSVDQLYRPVVTNGVTNGTWIYGNYLPSYGQYSVKEAFLETIVPIISGLDFNGAFRVTDYSTSGTVTTWKAGLTFQPISDIKFRGTVSRDIRAPNLSELFAAGTGRTNTVNRPTTAGTCPAGAALTICTDQFNESTVGNTDLKPEVAKTYGAGVVITPQFLPGFAVSVDYYNINISGAISSLNAQTLVEQCYNEANQTSCGFISTAAGRGVVTPGLAITSIEIKPFNFVSVKTEGIDFEASYRRHVGPGNLTLRALASHAIDLKTDNGVNAVTDGAGDNSGSLPNWTYRFSAGYDFDTGFSVQALVRGVSAGVYGNNYVVCTSACPASSADYRTINYNHIPGGRYVDMNASYTFKVAGISTQAFLSVRNVLNSDPVAVAIGPTGNNTPAYPQTNRNLYDVMGRVFRMGIRLKY